jgi:hypothetical protein
VTTITAPSPKAARRQRQAGLLRATEHGVFGLVPVAATLALILVQFHLRAVAIDFHVAYWPAVHRLLHGLSPYAVTHKQLAGGTAFVYPALAAVLLSPFGLVSDNIAQVLYMLLCLACVPAILRTFNIRDWRLYGLTLLWFPVFNGWQSGNVTLPLILMIALAWRHRDRAVVAGLLTAVAISLKLFVWPLGLWLLVTRRWRAAAYALGFGLVVNLVAWALVGFNEISVFLHLSSEDTTALWRGGYSMLAVARHLGFGRGTGEALLLVTSALTAAATIYAGIFKRRERGALVLAVLLMLFASPLLWAHYFALLLIPLALYRPRLSPVWALPVLMWPMPPRQPVLGWQEVLAWGVTAAMLASTYRASRRPSLP